MTVVAEDDWMAVVTRAPVRIPRTGLPVTVPSTERILFPANFCRPSLINFIPKRKMARAPAKLSKMIRISIKFIRIII
jgi:hypothetical protein